MEIIKTSKLWSLCLFFHKCLVVTNIIFIQTEGVWEIARSQKIGPSVCYYLVVKVVYDIMGVSKAYNTLRRQS